MYSAKDKDGAGKKDNADQKSYKNVQKGFKKKQKRNDNDQKIYKHDQKRIKDDQARDPKDANVKKRTGTDMNQGRQRRRQVG